MSGTTGPFEPDGWVFRVELTGNLGCAIALCLRLEGHRGSPDTPRREPNCVRLCLPGTRRRRNGTRDGERDLSSALRGAGRDRLGATAGAQQDRRSAGHRDPGKRAQLRLPRAPGPLRASTRGRGSSPREQLRARPPSRNQCQESNEVQRRYAIISNSVHFCPRSNEAQNPRRPLAARSRQHQPSSSCLLPFAPAVEDRTRSRDRRAIAAEHRPRRALLSEAGARCGCTAWASSSRRGRSLWPPRRTRIPR